jgi:hypothetical protein
MVCGMDKPLGRINTNNCVFIVIWIRSNLSVLIWIVLP